MCLKVSEYQLVMVFCGSLELGVISTIQFAHPGVSHTLWLLPGCAKPLLMLEMQLVDTKRY
jgi:hypothetical protein